MRARGKRERRFTYTTVTTPKNGLSSCRCLYLTPEERLGSRPTVLIVDEFEEEEVEKRDEGCHTEPEEEGQAWVLFGHVVLVSQDSLDVHRVSQVLQVSKISGDVQQRRDGLGDHHRKRVTSQL